MPRGLASFVQSEIRLPTNLQWSLQSKDARKTPERTFMRSCLRGEIPPLAPTFAPKMPTRSVSTRAAPNVLFPTGARERFPIPFREVKYLWSEQLSFLSPDLRAGTS